MFASLNVLGNRPSSRDLLKSCDNGLAINKAINFSNFTGIPSGPVDLFASSEFHNFRTSCSLVLMLSSIGTSGMSQIGGTCVSGMLSVD